jgi:hypothetical protein
LYELYHLATEDKEDVALLESCNKVFINPKAKTAKSASNAVRVPTTNEEYLPDFPDALSRLAVLLKTDVIIILDAIENLSPKEQGELVSNLKRLVAFEGAQRIRLLVSDSQRIIFFSRVVLIMKHGCFSPMTQLLTLSAV